LPAKTRNNSKMSLFIMSKLSQFLLVYNATRVQLFNADKGIFVSGFLEIINPPESQILSDG
jgi:hypothetical protein